MVMSGGVSKNNKSVQSDKGECVWKDHWKDGPHKEYLSGEILSEENYKDKYLSGNKELLTKNEITSYLEPLLLSEKQIWLRKNVQI